MITYDDSINFVKCINKLRKMIAGGGILITFFGILIMQFSQEINPGFAITCFGAILMLISWIESETFLSIRRIIYK